MVAYRTYSLEKIHYDRTEPILKQFAYRRKIQPNTSACIKWLIKSQNKNIKLNNYELVNQDSHPYRGISWYFSMSSSRTIISNSKIASHAEWLVAFASKSIRPFLQTCCLCNARILQTWIRPSTFRLQPSSYARITDG